MRMETLADPWILWVDELGLADVPRVGAKNASCGEVLATGRSLGEKIRKGAARVICTSHAAVVVSRERGRDAGIATGPAPAVKENSHGRLSFPSASGRILPVKTDGGRRSATRSHPPTARTRA